MTSDSTIIELTPTYHIISTRSLLTDKPVFIDLFSQHPLWLIFLNKSSLSLIKSFNSLNKSAHHSFYIIVFSDPDTVRKKLGTSCDKKDIYWVEKRYKEHLLQHLQILQLPWVIHYERGVPSYSAHDFPTSLADLNSYRDEDLKQLPKNESPKKIELFKEQVQFLKKKIKKFERKEIEYKNEISDLKDSVKTYSAEILEMKRVIKDHETRTGLHTEVDNKLPLPGSKNLFQNSLLGYTKAVEPDFWRQENSSEIKDLYQITSSRDLWINHLESKVKAYGGKNKLFPIEYKKKNNSRPEFTNKHQTPEPGRYKAKKYFNN